MLVSNRGPVTYQEDGSVKRGTGGLATALIGLASHRDAVWIASAMTPQDVEPGTPAAEAGIRGGRGEVRFQIQTYAQGGDIITAVEGKPIADANDLSSAVAQFQPGQEVTVEVHRGSQTREIEVELGERPLSAPSSGG